MKAFAPASMAIIISLLYGTSLYGQNDVAMSDEQLHLADTATGESAIRDPTVEPSEQKSAEQQKTLQLARNASTLSASEPSTQLSASSGKDFARSHAVAATSKLIPEFPVAKPQERNYPSCRE